MANRNKDLLYPAFAKQLEAFEQLLSEAGLPFYLFEGVRTFKEQDHLYSLGRTMPGRIVTSAQGGDSWHNYHLAGDYVRDADTEKPGVQWSWDLKMDQNADGRDDWYQLGELAEKVGLEWGGRWKRFPDMPHVQNRFGLTIAEAKEIYKEEGVRGVWDACAL